MKSKLLELYQESMLLKLSFFLIIIFPIILLIGSSVINTAIVILNVFFIIHIFKHQNFKIFNNDIFYFFVGFWILLIINAFLSIDFNESYSRSFGFVRFILFYFLITYYFSFFKALLAASSSASCFDIPLPLSIIFLFKKTPTVKHLA